jgi:AcrR family transcriptional regulator
MPAKPSRTMPSTDDILDVATAVFAEMGYAGARVDEIAKAANVNKATLYYRIGDKDALYEAILKRIFATKVANMEHMLKTYDDAEDRVRAFAAVLVDDEHPEHFSAIMLREIANGGRNLPDSILPFMSRLIGVLEQTLADGVAQGRFKPVNPFMVHIILVGACTLYATNGPIRRRVAMMASKGSSLNTEMPISQVAHAIAEMLLGGIRTA